MDDEDLNPRIEDVVKKFERIQKMKVAVLNNKLNNRNDVQVLKKKIARLNQELIYSKQDMERAEEIFIQATAMYEQQQEQLKQYVGHLTIISTSHRENQEEQLQRLMDAMKMPLPPSTPPKRVEDSKHAPTGGRSGPRGAYTTGGGALRQ